MGSHGFAKVGRQGPFGLQGSLGTLGVPLGPPPRGPLYTPWAAPLGPRYTISPPTLGSKYAARHPLALVRMQRCQNAVDGEKMSKCHGHGIGLSYPPWCEMANTFDYTSDRRGLSMQVQADMLRSVAPRGNRNMYVHAQTVVYVANSYIFLLALRPQTALR